MKATQIIASGLAAWLLLAGQAAANTLTSDELITDKSTSDKSTADKLTAARQRYGELVKAWDSKKMDKVAQLLPGLRDYPLYPYLQYRQLTGQIRTATAGQINHFVQANAHSPLAGQLTSRFINELARRQAWPSLLAFSPQLPENQSGQCYYYTAKWKTKDSQAAWQGARALWRDGKTATACRELFAAWQASGDMRPQDYQHRLAQAFAKGQREQVTTLNQQMRTAFTATRALANALDALNKAPDAPVAFARAAPVSDFSRQMAALAFSKLARKNLPQARAALPSLVHIQRLNQAQRQSLEETLAWQMMDSSVTQSQAAFRDNVILHSHSTALIERRIRLALSQADWQGLSGWLARLPEADQQKDEWQYWRARLLLQQGQTQQADALLHSLAQRRGFYPMLAAQQRHQPYVFKVNRAPQPDARLLTSSVLARVRELKYWQQETPALREWRMLIARQPAPAQAALAHYANTQHWWDLGVQATIIGKLWDHLAQRFPLAYQPLFHRFLADKTLTLSYTMAIARQESAWNPQAHSSAGALGLMQLIPATASHTAKKFKISQYKSTAQLRDPAINIEIGSQYLQDVYQQFGNNRILAAAAYNAGPSRVRRWLINSDGKLDAVAFIESIPFAETRGYVKNVLAYDAYYRHLLGEKTILLLNEQEIRLY